MWTYLASFCLGGCLWGSFLLAALPKATLLLRVLVAGFGAASILCLRQLLRARPANSVYGTAAFASGSVLNALTLPNKPPLPTGSVLLGKKGNAWIALPAPYSAQHGIIVGGSGTGKSFGFFLPNMAYSQGASVVATDPKSELWSYTSGRHASTRFAPTEPDASAAFNWIPLCQNVRMASLCARAVVEAGAIERQAPPWPDLETAFLAALFSHASALSEPTPATAYQLLTENEPEQLMALFLASSSRTAREQAIIFQQTNERLRGAIAPVIAAKLQFLRDPAVARFTSASGAAPDFGRLRQTPQALYWCVREQDIALLRPLSALFFTVLLEQLADVRVFGQSAIPVHVFLDEFANIGIIPHYDTTISLARGRGLSLWHGIQSLSQLEARYGRANAQTILTNCATKIALSGLDVETAEYFSRALGESTTLVPRRTWQRKRFALFSHGISESLQPTARPLLTADEVRRIAAHKALVITGNRAPMLLDKIVFSEAPCTAQASALGSARRLTLPPTEEPPALPPERTPTAREPETLSLPLLERNPAPFRLIEPPAGNRGQEKRPRRSRVTALRL